MKKKVYVICNVEPISESLIMGKEYELLEHSLIESEAGKRVLIITEREGGTCATLGGKGNWKIVKDEQRVF